MIVEHAPDVRAGTKSGSSTTRDLWRPRVRRAEPGRWKVYVPTSRGEFIAVYQCQTWQCAMDCAGRYRRGLGWPS